MCTHGSVIFPVPVFIVKTFCLGQIAETFIIKSMSKRYPYFHKQDFI